MASFDLTTLKIGLSDESWFLQEKSTIKLAIKVILLNIAIILFLNKTIFQAQN
jgi:hypothetical protein